MRVEKRIIAENRIISSTPMAAPNHSQSSGRPSTQPQSTEPQFIKPKMQKIHDLFIQPIDRTYWLEKIWTTEKLESHANAEPITILYWFRVGYLQNALKSANKI